MAAIVNKTLRVTNSGYVRRNRRWDTDNLNDLSIYMWGAACFVHLISQVVRLITRFLRAQPARVQPHLESGPGRPPKEDVVTCIHQSGGPCTWPAIVNFGLENSPLALCTESGLQSRTFDVAHRPRWLTKYGLIIELLVNNSVLVHQLQFLPVSIMKLVFAIVCRPLDLT